ncbi:hypothetical protein QUF58_06785 [Anaerolineales bacterium HSG24]|nr:hypothetical protein [Anaerolineales bacterium HSG24]
MTSSKILHDIVSQSSTILSISQMAQFMYELSEPMEEQLEIIMDTAHEIVDLSGQIGLIFDAADEGETLDKATADPLLNKQLFSATAKINETVQQFLAIEGVPDEMQEDLNRVIAAVDETNNLAENLSKILAEA